MKETQISLKCNFSLGWLLTIETNHTHVIGFPKKGAGEAESTEQVAGRATDGWVDSMEAWSDLAPIGTAWRISSMGRSQAANMVHLRRMGALSCF